MIRIIASQCHSRSKMLSKNYFGENKKGLLHSPLCRVFVIITPPAGLVQKLTPVSQRYNIFLFRQNKIIQSLNAALAARCSRRCAAHEPIKPLLISLNAALAARCSRSNENVNMMTGFNNVSMPLSQQDALEVHNKMKSLNEHIEVSMPLSQQDALEVAAKEVSRKRI